MRPPNNVIRSLSQLFQKQQVSLIGVNNSYGRALSSCPPDVGSFASFHLESNANDDRLKKNHNTLNYQKKNEVYSRRFSNNPFGQGRRSSFERLARDNASSASGKQSKRPVDFRRNRAQQSGRKHPGDRAGKYDTQRMGGKGKYSDERNRPLLSKTHILSLEERTKDHIHCFPDSNIGDEHSIALSSWQRTATDLIMEWSQLWGRKSRSQPHQTPADHVHLGVSLADELIRKILEARKSELDRLEDARKDHPSLEEEIDRGQRSKRSTTPNTGEKSFLNTESICQLITLGWSRCDPRIATDGALKAQSLLIHLEEISSRLERLSLHRLIKEKGKAANFKIDDVKPTIRMYNHVLSCWSRSLDPNASKYALSLLDRMSSSQGAYAAPDTITYNNILHMFANRGDVDNAEDLLKQMEQSSSNISPDVYSYSIVMNATQKRFMSSGSNRDWRDPERAEELLSRMVTRYEKSGFKDESLRPNRVMLGTVLSTYAAADRVWKIDRQKITSRVGWGKNSTIAQDFRGNVLNAPKALGWGAENAERVLDWIVGLYERERKGKSDEQLIGGYRSNDAAYVNHFTQPCAQHFVTVIDAWAKADKGIEGAQRCEYLCDRLIALYQASGGNPELRPVPQCFGAVIDAWSKSNGGESSAERAETLLGRMEENFLHSSNPKESLSNVAYNLVMDAWSRCRGSEAPARAEKILHRMIKNYSLTGNKSLMPDVISFTAVMKAYVNHPDGGKKAIEMLKEMKSQFSKGNIRAKPDVWALSVAIDACAKNNLVGEAERLLDEVDDSEKTRVLFNTIMSGYQKDGLGSKAESMLRRMISLSDAGYKKCSPDSLSYNICIDAWGKSTSEDRRDRAEALLDEILERNRKGDPNNRPNSAHFNSLAQLIANSENPEAETDILGLFQKMEEFGIKPCLVSFHTLIRACSKATGSEERKRKALQIAVSSFNSLEAAKLHPSSVTYASIMYAIQKLETDSHKRVRALAFIFESCCRNGLLGSRAINFLARSLPVEEFLAITGVSHDGCAPELKDLPPSWSCNSDETYASDNA